MWAVDALVGPVAAVNREGSGSHEATSSQHRTCLKCGDGSYQHSFRYLMHLCCSSESFVLIFLVALGPVKLRTLNLD